MEVLENMGSFMEEDVLSIAKRLTNFKNSRIITIYPESEDKVKELRDFVVTQDENTVILAEAYISSKEFPADEYYFYSNEDTYNKKPIPVNEVLLRESEAFEDAGFENINHLVGYEYKVAFLYPNEIGKKIIAEINTIPSYSNLVGIVVYKNTIIKGYQGDDNLAIVYVNRPFVEKYLNELYEGHTFENVDRFLDEYCADETQDFYEFALNNGAIRKIENY